MPPGRGRFSDNLVSAIGEVTTQSFILGIRAAAPVMAALLIATLIVGLISRTARCRSSTRSRSASASTR
jgi:flagellar biosynthesis protein FliR